VTGKTRVIKQTQALAKAMKALVRHSRRHPKGDTVVRALKAVDTLW
jgi:hypothetical protein